MGVFSFLLFLRCLSDAHPFTFQTANNLFTLGDPGNAYTCNLVASTAGVGLQGVGCHYKVFDLSSFGTPQDLNAGNQHINVFLLTNGQQLRINGAGGSAYTPFDGQVAIIYLKGAGSCTVYGYIAGSLQTITLSTTNGYLKYMWQAAQGYWFAAP